MEEKASVGELVRDFIQRNLLIVGLIIIGVILSAIGGVQYLSSNNTKSELEFTTGTDSMQAAEVVAGAADKVTEITIDVAGEVVKPGIYTLKTGERIADAIDAAGGLTGNADGDYVAKKINLAQKIIDGGKVYIPAVGEVPPVAASTVSIAGAGTSSTDTSTGLIDINSADEKALDTLPKIGPVTAQKIIDNRPYATIEELVSKKVLTQKTFDGLKDRIIAQ